MRLLCSTPSHFDHAARSSHIALRPISALRLKPPPRIHWFSFPSICATLAFLILILAWQDVAQSDEAIKRTCETPAASQSTSRDCHCAPGWSPTQAHVDEIISKPKIWKKFRSDIIDPQSSETSQASSAVFCNSIIMVGTFSEVDLAHADFRYSTILAKAPLARIIVPQKSEGSVEKPSDTTPSSIGVEFKGSILNEANFTGAQLRRVSFSGAILQKTKFIDSNLSYADFSNAQLLETELHGARFEGVNLAGAIYDPSSPPSARYLGGIRGLSEVTFPTGRPIALVKLRNLLRDSGLRDLERQATYAVEHNKTDEMINGCPWRPLNSQLRLMQPGSSLWINCLHGVARMIFFEMTTKWGATPSRALLILLAVVLLTTPVYCVGLLISRRKPESVSGIFQVVPHGRFQFNGDQVIASGHTAIQRLKSSWFTAPLWALYFSILSTFQIGWRDFNLGTWIERLQSTEYVLRSSGWIRCVSGLQAIISVYLFAIWILTYFGRPFQ